MICDLNIWHAGYLGLSRSFECQVRGFVGHMMMNDSVSVKDTVTHIKRRRILWIHVDIFWLFVQFSVILCQCDVK